MHVYVVLIALGIIIAGVALALTLRFGHGQYLSGAKAAVSLGQGERADLLAQLAHATAQWEEWEKKSNSFSKVIGGIIAEKEKWQALYFDQVTCHGNAQEFLTGFNAFLQEKLRAHGIEIQAPPVLEELRQDFLQKHEIPVRSELGTPRIDEKALLKSQPLDETEKT